MPTRQALFVAEVHFSPRWEAARFQHELAPAAKAPCVFALTMHFPSVIAENRFSLLSVQLLWKQSVILEIRITRSFSKVKEGISMSQE